MQVDEVIEAIPVAELPKPPARWQDKLRVGGAASRYVARALVWRIARRAVNPRWPLGMELLVAATRGSWSSCPRSASSSGGTSATR